MSYDIISYEFHDFHDLHELHFFLAIFNNFYIFTFYFNISFMPTMMTHGFIEMLVKCQKNCAIWTF